MTAISFGLSCLGFILLSLSLKRHYQQVWPQSSNYNRWLPLNRGLGYVLVFGALAPCVILRGFWIGLVLWISILALAAFLQAMLLTYRPQFSIAFGAAGIALIAAGLMT